MSEHICKVYQFENDNFPFEIKVIVSLESTRPDEKGLQYGLMAPMTEKVKV